MLTNAEAIRRLVDVFLNKAGNMPTQPGIYPNYSAPIVRNGADGPELAMTRWGMPTSPYALLKGKPNGTDVRTVRDPGTTNIRDTRLAHWRQWFGIEHRCGVPATSFAEPDGERGPPLWFALDQSRPLFFFAGLWVPQWTSIRRVKDGPTTDDLFGFFTTNPNREIAAVHPKAMPVILRTREEVDIWMKAPADEALVGRGTPKDTGGAV